MTVTRRQAVVIVLLMLVAVALVFLASALDSYAPLLLVWPVLACVPLYVGATDRRARSAPAVGADPAGGPARGEPAGSRSDQA